MLRNSVEPIRLKKEFEHIYYENKSEDSLYADGTMFTFYTALLLQEHHVIGTAFEGSVHSNVGRADFILIIFLVLQDFGCSKSMDKQYFSPTHHLNVGLYSFS